MITLRYQGARLLAGISAGVLLIAGCGGNDDAASNSAAPTTPRDQLLLSESEFPAGTKKVDLPKDRLETAAADLAGTQQSSTITPAECASTQQDLGTATKDLLADASVAGATDEKAGLMFVEFVAGRTADLAKITDGNKKCGEVSATSTVEGKQITSVVKVENMDAPAGLNGAEAIVYKSVSTSTVGAGKPLTSTAYQGMAVLRGTTVVVRVAALKDSLDEAAFEKFFLDAVEKVRKAA
ncbi:hypothetical protein [Nocardia amikacinitolerans]|uniref:hypothetical protein n=1 Tax=Nocardia amikacinitolerans TaxID=756689 RepID=UPI0020A542B7|nr:hypothetical protein [Nocardia amikacinitolerans]